MKSTMKSTLPLSQTTLFLYANVTEWSCGYDCSSPDAATDHLSPMLRLSGIINPHFADFVAPLPLELSLICGEHQADAQFLSPWRLSLVESLDEYGIPTLLEGALPLPEKAGST